MSCSLSKKEKGNGRKEEVGENRMRLKDYLDEAGFKKFPKGWTEESIVKFAKTLVKDAGIEGGDKKGFFDACVTKMSGEMDNPEGFCAAVKDVVVDSTFWRGKGKTEKEVKKLAKEHPNV
jgi:hypothetical protein